MQNLRATYCLEVYARLSALDCPRLDFCTRHSDLEQTSHPSSITKDWASSARRTFKACQPTPPNDFIRSIVPEDNLSESASMSMQMKNGTYHISCLLPVKWWISVDDNKRFIVELECMISFRCERLDIVCIHASLCLVDNSTVVLGLLDFVKQWLRIEVVVEDLSTFRACRVEIHAESRLSWGLHHHFLQIWKVHFADNGSNRWAARRAISSKKTDFRDREANQGRYPVCQGRAKDVVELIRELGGQVVWPSSFGVDLSGHQIQWIQAYPFAWFENRDGEYDRMVFVGEHEFVDAVAQF